MLQLLPERALSNQVSLEKRLKKLVLVLAICTPVTRTRKKAFETAETAKTAEASKNGEENEGGENLRSNLAQILYIWYPITF